MGTMMVFLEARGESPPAGFSLYPSRVLRDASTTL